MNTLVEATSSVAARAAKLGPTHCALLLHTEQGPPVLMVDNYPDVTDEYRVQTGPSQLNWDRNPILQAIRAHLGLHVAEAIDRKMFSLARDHGYTGSEMHHFAAPMLAASGWFATIMFAQPKSCSRELERELTMVVAELSAWCVTRGIDIVPRIEPGLTPRGYEIGQLVREGMTNVEIGDELGISINTVKQRLKEVFSRLEIGTREELAAIMRRLAPLEGIPFGVSERGSVKITRASHTAAWVLTAA